MYRMPAAEQPGPRIGGPLTVWHAHDNLCRADGRVVAVAARGACAKGSLSPTPEMLHVWLVENPDGVFSDDMEPAALAQVVQGEGPSLTSATMYEQMFRHGRVRCLSRWPSTAAT